MSLSGRLEHQTLEKDLWLSLAQNERKNLVSIGKLVIDLEQVEFVDTAGLAWLINAIRQAQEAKVQAVLANAPDKLIKLAKISDVDRLLPLQ